ncbi:MAG TPA: hypothetical protein VGR94_09190 [Candidatus Acidoferrales bacterium]|nr:hypothetical protein [Candidatus Acidoferrales bacterium]
MKTKRHCTVWGKTDGGGKEIGPAAVAKNRTVEGKVYNCVERIIAFMKSFLDCDHDTSGASNA